ncbi:MptD family putative ECF transporter S component [Olsenella phocaeensis]|uniref:MptD family putative ECF transporter S component n=1 Tax=Olsenella phocaeensis TaxID=1852385 RepID=UPI0009318AB6|nr:MptD family putative ECF transporter S component [Olsenella phocaeensis]
MSGEKEDEKGKATEPNRGWGVREVVTAALLSALTVVIMFVGSMLTMFSYDFAMVASGGAAVFLAAPVYMLMVRRVNRLGVTTVFTTVAALLFCTMGNMLFMLPFYVLGGLLLDLVCLRTQRQRQNPWWATASWTAFSGLYLLSTLIPYLGNMDAYVSQTMLERGLDQSYADAFFKYYGNPVWVVAIMIATMVVGFLGCLVGRTLMKRHFERAGAL